MLARRKFGDICESVAQVCRGFPGKYWQQCDASRSYPTEFVDAISALGVMGSLIDAKHGGLGLPLRAACEILRTINATGCNAATIHAQLYTSEIMSSFLSEQQKRDTLTKLASGDLRLQAFGVTESDAGSDTLSISTKAEVCGDGWILNGAKCWTSRVQHSDLMLVVARTSHFEGKRSSKGLSLFLVDLESPGIEINPIRTMLNHATCAVNFSDVRLSSSSLIGEEGDGWKMLVTGLNSERLLIASECLGDCDFFFDVATKYVSDRKVFGKTLGSNQSLSFPLADAFAQSFAAECVVNDALETFERQGSVAVRHSATMAKYLASNASWSAAEAALQSLGGMGFACEMDVERKWRETRLFRTAPLSNEIMLSQIATHMGMPRSF